MLEVDGMYTGEGQGEANTETGLESNQTMMPQLLGQKSMFWGDDPDI